MTQESSGDRALVPDLAEAWARVGLIHVDLARQTPDTAAAADWRDALSAYRKSEALYPPARQEQRDEVRRQIALCQQALASGGLR